MRKRQPQSWIWILHGKTVACSSNLNPVSTGKPGATEFKHQDLSELLLPLVDFCFFSLIDDEFSDLFESNILLIYFIELSLLFIFSISLLFIF